MKTVRILALVLMLALTVAACGSAGTMSPEELLQAYIEAQNNQNEVFFKENAQIEYLEAEASRLMGGFQASKWAVFYRDCIGSIITHRNKL